LASGRTVGLKKAPFKTIAEFFATEQGFRQEDVFINLVETSRENWSFGNGIAQHADGPPPHLARFENPK
jgi:4-oxalocrotonate tautomerase